MEEELKKLESDLIAMMDDRFMGVEDSLARLINLGEQHQKALSFSEMTVQRFLPQFGMCVMICSALIVVPVAAGAWYAQEGKIRQLQVQAREAQGSAIKSSAYDRLYQAAEPGLKLRMQNAVRQVAGQTGETGQ
ncbi:hypothetical protein BI347_20515 [Chromobacterium sphagni]|uniref:Uncharacterized protein n=1 Tax=Chromobacterium sphagni TaxID=1903179 RepID=A0A1S1WT95_9NEIS|nr:hypothetical protein [Chromobacterium sphagni]OHX10194.1 hypothetical protein BI347_20515 [Chromobacterium sphagni]